MRARRITPPVRRWRPLAVTAAVAIATAAAPVAARAGEVRFGPNLAKVTPTLDTANGAYSHTGSAAGTEHAISPDPHAAEDTAIFNTALPRGHAVAPRGGQVLSVRVKGCAIEDMTAPTQASQGVAVNALVFQTLAPASGSWTVTANATEANFKLPFCSSSAHPATGAVSTGTVTTFHPLHECLGAGDSVSFHDIGGFVPAAAGKGPWYPQGVPFDVIARASGASLASYVGFASAYGPSSPGGSGAGWATESGEELTMQVIEGTATDAYGLCPGGKANESSTSNAVICDYGVRGADHPECNAQGQPIPGTQGTPRK